VLFIFGGLPGTGKSALSSHLAHMVGGLYLRIDTIEQAIHDGGIQITGPEGYLVAYKIASDNLRLGLTVIADSVNPLNLTRRAWREVALQAGAAFCEIEVICSDKDEHRSRVETRSNQITGLKLPAWKDVEAREYDVWEKEHLVLDTAGQTLEESRKALKRMVEENCQT
jgi:predicted kinase